MSSSNASCSSSCNYISRRDDDIDDNNQQHHQSVVRTISNTSTPPIVAAAAPSPSLLEKWSDIITKPLALASCSGCLTQVSEQEGDDNIDDRLDDNTPLQQQQSTSLFDYDESTTISPTTPTRESSCRPLINTNNTFDAVPNSNINHDNQVGGEVDNEICPICLDAMSTCDKIYPIRCPSSATSSCKYNFCLDCMTSLVKSSQDDYQLSSDGSMRVKVALQCPNCRSDIAGIIEPIIRLRQEANFTAHVLNEKLTHGTISSSTSHFKNRSTAYPRSIHQKRITNLIEKIAAMPTPTYVRHQVLSVSRHGEDEMAVHEGSSSTVSFNDIDDDVSQSSSLSLEVQVVQPFSSPTVTTSPPFTRPSKPTAAAVVTPPVSSPHHTSTIVHHSSPQVNRIRLDDMLIPRRTKSFQTPASTSLLFESESSMKNKKNKKKEASPKSILDDFFGDEWSSKEANSRRNQSSSPSTTPSKVCLKGINFSDGDDGFFASAIDLDWCCSSNNITSENSIDLRSTSSKKRTLRRRVVGSGHIEQGKGCGGYIDYGGIYHPCTNISKDGEDDDRIINIPTTPCQGCSFRQGMHTHNEYDEEDQDDLYYDSDPGQHFDIGGSMSAMTRPPSPPSSCEPQETPQKARRTSTGQLAKLRWRRRRNKSSKSSNTGSSSSSSQDGTSTSSFSEAIQKKKDDGPKEDQQAYLYRYFSRTDDSASEEKSMRTGPYCSTNEKDVGNYVQEALNSKWRLTWHTNNKMTKVCDVWIERGYRRNRTEIVEPKLMWREIMQPNLQDRRKLGFSTVNPYRVSLFALRRIFQVMPGADGGWEEITKNHPHQDKQVAATKSKPMANLNSVLLVRSSLGDDYVFEAACPEERDMIVHLWKMTTARLVSHAVSGNGEAMIKEYFNEEFIAGGIEGL